MAIIDERLSNLPIHKWKQNLESNNRKESNARKVNQRIRSKGQIVMHICVQVKERRQKPRRESQFVSMISIKSVVVYFKHRRITVQAEADTIRHHEFIVDEDNDVANGHNPSIGNGHHPTATSISDKKQEHGWSNLWCKFIFSTPTTSQRASNGMGRYTQDKVPHMCVSVCIWVTQTMPHIYCC